jgi:hypothetical protein
MGWQRRDSRLALSAEARSTSCYTTSGHELAEPFRTLHESRMLAATSIDILAV